MRKLLLALLTLTIVAFGSLFVWPYAVHRLLKTSDIATPGPLRVALPKKLGILTVAGVVTETNRHRALAKVPPLTHNAALDRAAQKKADDILARQYFDHVAPDGTGPADLVESVGYAYLRVGENLALGAFPNDATLVQAWMDSPGHRANILSPRFTEIGVGLARGRFESEETWVAVQTFAAPAAACPTPSAAEESAIKSKRQELKQRATQLEAAQHQALLADLNQRITAYNRAIRQYNACLNR